MVVGHWVTVKCGVKLWRALSKSDDVFILPINATFTYSHFPQRKKYPGIYFQSLIDAGASIGRMGGHPAWPHDCRLRVGWSWQRGDEVGDGKGGDWGQSLLSSASIAGGL